MHDKRHQPPALMRAVVCDGADKHLSTLHVHQVPVPDAGPGEVRVRLHAASLNPVDWKLADGTAPWLNAPLIMGLDGAGVIDQVGESAGDWHVGDRVVWHGSLSKPGVFADFGIAPAHVLARIPSQVSFAAAAALPCAGMTAYQALIRKARLQAGQTLLVQGASGAVGGFALQIAKSLGATTIALANAAQADRVRALGADHVLDRRDPGLAQKIRALTGGYGVDVMLEVANPGDARTSLELIRYNGQLLCIDPMPNLANVPPYTYAASIHEVALGGAYAAGHRPTQEDFAVMLTALLAQVAAGSLDPMIERRILLEQVAQGLADMRAGGQAGKTVVEMLVC